MEKTRLKKTVLIVVACCGLLACSVVGWHYARTRRDAALVERFKQLSLLSTPSAGRELVEFFVEGAPATRYAAVLQLAGNPTAAGDDLIVYSFTVGHQVGTQGDPILEVFVNTKSGRIHCCEIAHADL